MAADRLYFDRRFKLSECTYLLSNCKSFITILCALNLTPVSP